MKLSVFKPPAFILYYIVPGSMKRIPARLDVILSSWTNAGSIPVTGRLLHRGFFADKSGSSELHHYTCCSLGSKERNETGHTIAFIIRKCNNQPSVIRA